MALVSMRRRVSVRRRDFRVGWVELEIKSALEAKGWIEEQRREVRGLKMMSGRGKCRLTYLGLAEIGVWRAQVTKMRTSP